MARARCPVPIPRRPCSLIGYERMTPDHKRANTFYRWVTGWGSMVLACSRSAAHAA